MDLFSHIPLFFGHFSHIPLIFCPSFPYPTIFVHIFPYPTIFPHVFSSSTIFWLILTVFDWKETSNNSYSSIYLSYQQLLYCPISESVTHVKQKCNTRNTDLCVYINAISIHVLAKVVYILLASSFVYCTYTQTQLSLQ